MFKDGLRFRDEESEDEVIFNYYSFCEILKWIIVKYADRTYEEADCLVRKHPVSEVPKSFSEVTLITHELEYHWAMLIAHGNMYWLRGIASDFNSFSDEYFEWEDSIRKRYQLKEPYTYLNAE